MVNSAAYSDMVFETPERFEEYFDQRTGEQSVSTVTPIASKGFQARAKVVSTSRSRVEYATWSSLRVDGLVSADAFTFAPFLWSSERNSIWRQPIKSNDLAWTSPGRDRCANFPDPVELVVATVPFETVLAKCNSRGLDVEHILRAKERKVAAPAVACKRIETTALEILRASAASENGLPETIVDSGVDLLLDAFLEALARVEDKTERPRARFGSYEQLVRKVEDVLHERPGELIEVSQAAEAVGVSRDTLHCAFSEVVGTSPGRYLRNWRLSRARRDLIECKYDSVTECAIAWGFLDVGRFAGYYRSLFSELPSETLRNARCY